MDKKRILIVEDEAAMVDALGKKFEKEGFQVYKSHDGEEGLSMAEREHPDLIMLDIIMPKVDGLEFLRRIRQDQKWGAEVPVIMLTNLSDADNVSEAAKYGVFDFLVKTDWRLEDVVQLVKQKLYINI